MDSVTEQLEAKFTQWAARGCGALVYPHPVRPAPPLSPFTGHRLAAPRVKDDGRRPNFFSRIVEGARLALAQPTTQSCAKGTDEAEVDPSPHWFGESAPLVELRLLIPGDLSVPPEQMAHFLQDLAQARFPVTLELAGCKGTCWIQLAVSE